MSSNDEGSTSIEATPSSTVNQQDHVNLRVTYLLPGNPRPPHDLGWIALQTSILQIKSRIQDELPEHPSPEEQRLIYQGRPLLRNETTLREALRIEGSSVGPLPYTIHIIIQSRPTSSNTAASTVPPPSQPLQNESSTNTINPRPVPSVTFQQNNVPGQAMAQAQAVQAMLQTQLSVLQQQLSMLNPSIGQHAGQAPNGVNSTIHINGQPVGPTGQPLGITPGLQQAPFVNPTGLPNLQNAQNMHMMAHNNAQRGQGLNLPGNYQGALNIPIQPLGGTNVRETIGPNGERIRTIINGSMNIQFGGPGMPNPFNRPASAPGHPSAENPVLPPNLTQQGSLATSINDSRRLPLPANPAQTLFPFQNQVDQYSSPTSRPQTFAWLASSPRGPEAIVFAPNHGYFTSTQPNAHVQHVDVNTGHHHPTDQAGNLASNTTLPAPTTTQRTRGENPDANAPAEGPVAAQIAGENQLPLRAPDQRPALVQNQNQILNRNQDDFFGFVVQRGWLFLRLYMFTFVLSEPGTWRRLFLLTVAMVVCLLPRRNPIYDAMEVARRHVDNLIGPTQPRPQQQPPAGGVGVPQEAGGVNRVQRPTEQQQNGGVGTIGNLAFTAGDSANQQPLQRPPNFVRDVFYRIEQAIALFLASLIPGVGERHVRAREEARRELQRQQQQQQENEQAQRAAEAETEAATVSVPSLQESKSESTNDKRNKSSNVVDATDELLADTPEASAGGSSAVDIQGKEAKKRHSPAETSNVIE